MSLDPKRAVAELKELRALTGDENGAQRVAWTDTWLKAREWFAAKVTSLPVEHHYDAASNNWVTLRGVSEKSLLIGGHLDSVPNGGWLDGALNVIAGLEVLRRIAAELGAVHRLRCVSSTGPMKKVHVLAAACWVRRPSLARIPLMLTAFAPTANGVKMEDALRRCGVDMAKFPAAEKEQKNAPPISNCISSKGPCSSACTCRSLLF